ncbi:hypothetical protein NN561_009521 [Cricetulus griseus]
MRLSSDSHRAGAEHTRGRTVTACTVPAPGPPGAQSPPRGRWRRWLPQVHAVATRTVPRSQRQGAARHPEPDLDPDPARNAPPGAPELARAQNCSPRITSRGRSRDAPGQGRVGRKAQILPPAGPSGHCGSSLEAQRGREATRRSDAVPAGRDSCLLLARRLLIPA